MKIMIFSGTSEGRRLSKMLSSEGIAHFVCVATGYGRNIMPSSDIVTVNAGRLDEDGMREYMAEKGFGKDDIVVDATHPYAVEVSENIQKAVQRTGCRIIKVARSSETDAGRCFGTMGDFAAFIDGEEGNILLTTGTNTLDEYCTRVSPQTLERTYVRVIPSKESVDTALSCGIEGSHIIAMQGPFTYDMNRAVFEQFQIRHMLTKESGAAGGFPEKCDAADSLGVSVNVIARPAAGEGVSVFEAYGIITGREYVPKRRIVLAGFGPGRKSSATHDVTDAVCRADAVFGATRLLAGVRAPRKYEMYMAEDIIRVLEENRDIENAVVLFSGDPGFYSGAKSAAIKFKEWDSGADVRILSGVSSVSYLAAAAGVTWEDAALVSIHGRNLARDIDRLIESVKANSKTFALVSGDSDIRKVAGILNKLELPVNVLLGCDLSYENGKIVSMSLKEAMEYKNDGIITVLFINDKPVKEKLTPGFDDGDFTRDSVPMTKEVIRHESIRRLGLCKGDIVYDIGGGTGSVAIEAASVDPSLSVTTIERDPKAVKLIKENIEKFGLHNIEVIEGDAADALADLDCPDCVFIGGSGGKLDRIIETLTQKGTGIRFVANAVTLETMDEIRRITGKYNASDVRMVQIAVSDIKAVGAHHMMQAQNPVTIVSFRI